MMEAMRDKPGKTRPNRTEASGVKSSPLRNAVESK